MTDFDFGAEPTEYKSPYKLWPTEGNLTALVDGDMLPYIVGYTVDELRAMRAINMAKFIYNAEPDPEDWEWVECLLKQPYFADKVDHLDTTLNSWIEGAGADSAIIYLTHSASNFRVNIAFSHKYKGERPKDKPTFFYEMRHYIKKKHNAIVSNGNEADDLMSIEQCKRNQALYKEGVQQDSPMHKELSTSIIVSKDKDLRIVAGWNYNPDHGKTWTDKIGTLEPKYVEREGAVYEQWPLFSGKPVDPKSVDVYEEDSRYYLVDGTCQDVYTRGKDKDKGKFKRMQAGYVMKQVIEEVKGSGLKFFYAQLITGDTVDNYKGIPGAGATLAFETLNHLNTEQELYYAVLELYKQKRCLGADAIWVENYRGGR